MALDALEDLWRNCKSPKTVDLAHRHTQTHQVLLLILFSDDEAKIPAGKLLAKWRPQLLASETKANTTPTLNGIQHPDDVKPTAPSSAFPSTTEPEGKQMKSHQVSPPVAAAG